MELRKYANKNWALIELTIVILFFALSASIVVECFVGAKVLSEEASEKADAVIVAQDIIESWANDIKGSKWVDGEYEEIINGKKVDVKIDKEHTKSGVLAYMNIKVYGSSGEEIINVNKSEYVSEN